MLPVLVLQEPLYHRAGALVQHLINWRGTSATIAGRFEELIIDLYERGYVEWQDVGLTQQWLLALQTVGYEFPGLAPATQTSGRAAVCVSGQMRTANATIENISRNLFHVLQGDYDVFAFIQTRGSEQEPQPGDTKVSAKNLS